ncbi:helix-turn-helix domain-containing protein [Caballeronia sp. AZ10_KS36]|uniref:IclR family transcriptional regulator n=1 Tax=Caballeronia sp. AZ10_KS36 TaxID=2921757 RepID=UPI0020288321|nr:helix-turn-helix domain-containing protein [Caballeronia sp. AZ10_KS36]
MKPNNKDDEQIDRSVAAVDRTLSLLEAFMGQPGGRSLSELEERTGLFKSVILRYMLSLEARGFVHKEQNGMYRLGYKAAQLGRAFESSVELVSTLRPVVERLSEKTSASASVYVRDGDARLCLLRAEPERDVRVAIRAGTRRPMDKSASSLAFKRFERKTVQAFATAGVAGIASSSGVGDPLLASMAAPLFGVSDAFVGVLTLSGVIGHFDVDDERIRSLLFDEALAASALLGAAP